MPTYVRDYELTINHSVAIEADSDADAARIFDQIERGNRSWYYLNNEVFEPMGEYLMNEARYVVEDIRPLMGVYQDEDFSEDVIDYSRYMEE